MSSHISSFSQRTTTMILSLGGGTITFLSFVVCLLSSDAAFAFSLNGKTIQTTQSAIESAVPSNGTVHFGSTNNLVSYGKSIGNWGHTWWQWALSLPTKDNPIVQDGTVDCSVGQSGKVWFLAGTFGESAERTCSIKKGMALFFPLYNGIYWTPLDPALPEDCIDEFTCRTGVGASIDKLTHWACTLDGAPCVWSYSVVRAQSNARRFNVVAGSILTDFGYAPGIRETSISDGYWVMLDPLPAGQHTLHFTSSNEEGFSLDVTYHLTVN